MTIWEDARQRMEAWSDDKLIWTQERLAEEIQRRIKRGSIRVNPLGDLDTGSELDNDLFGDIHRAYAKCS